MQTVAERTLLLFVRIEASEVENRGKQKLKVEEELVYPASLKLQAPSKTYLQFACPQLKLNINSPPKNRQSAGQVKS